MAGKRVTIAGVCQLLLEMLEEAMLAEEPEMERVCVEARSREQTPVAETESLMGRRASQAI